METLDAIRELMNRINNTNIKIEDIESEKLSIEDKEKLVKIIDDAKRKWNVFT